MKDVKQLAARWQGRGDEKSDTQKFWLELLHDVCGVERPADIVDFEKRVELGHKSFIDAYIPSTRVIVEQKSLDVSLDRATKQSDGTSATPFEQAKRYSDWLPYGERARWIVVCNFGEFRVHDMEYPKAEPEIIKLEDLPAKWRLLQFLADVRGASPREVRELEVSVQAGALAGKLYDALKGRYVRPGESSLRSLNVLCVRVVFLLYAEDAGLFPKGAFHDYLMAHRDSARHALMALFEVLSRKPEERDPYETELNRFPYINGGLFEERGIEVPNIDGEPLEIILAEMSGGFDWSGISPTIFGAVFESTLNEATRRAGGMHYTSIENIHRVIDPLFLDGLRKELDGILSAPAGGGRTVRLRNFQKRLASMTFLDPACGSGNFLTETYLSLRRLENRVISELAHGQGQFAIDEFTPIQVSIGQFYGVEINDFAVSVARTALWIAEAQMMKETRAIVDIRDDVLPLKNYNHIVEGNALTLDWREVVPPEKLNYIMGNPPFVGYTYQSPEQKQDVERLCGIKKIDYVACWYFKAAAMMEDTAIRAAFVSTNSITQGEQVAAVWRPLFDRGVHIDFAWRTFVWDSEAVDKAHVHVVIVGFSSAPGDRTKTLYSGDGAQTAENINPYLVDGPTVFIEPRQKPLCDVPEMHRGSQPTDDGHLILTAQEKDELLEAEPQAVAFIRPFMMGKDFIERKPRYCLWLVGVAPSLLRQCPRVMERVKAVREFRLASQKEATRRKADTPMLFDEIKDCKTDYVAIPKVSSENRQYIPMDYLSADVIAGDKLFMISSPSPYCFGVLMSRVHMAWMRTVCGRLKSDYSYSNTIVYNNFPWPTPTDGQRAKIEQTARGILDARALYPDSSLADLYDELTMPPELRGAHKANDAAVRSAYGFGKDVTEAEVVAGLMGRYEGLVSSR